MLYLYHISVNLSCCRTRSLVTGAKYATTIPSNILKLTAAPVPGIFQGNMPRPEEVWDPIPQLAIVATPQTEYSSSIQPVGAY